MLQNLIILIPLATAYSAHTQLEHLLQGDWKTQGNVFPAIGCIDNILLNLIDIHRYLYIGIYIGSYVAHIFSIHVISSWAKANTSN